MIIQLKQIISQSAIAALTAIAAIGIMSPTQAASMNSLNRMSPERENIELPESLANSVLQQTSESSGLPVEALQIVESEYVYWGSGCRGLGIGSGFCTTIALSGWVVLVESGTQRWVYHDRSLAQHYGWNFDSEKQSWIYHMMNKASSFWKFNPFIWDFLDEPVDFLDKSSVEGLRYTMTDNMLFTSLSLMSSAVEDKLFTVSVEEPPISKPVYSNRSGIGFRDVENGGVGEFTITDINPSIDLFNPVLFPLGVGINDERIYRWRESFSYQVEVLQKRDSTPTPVSEPHSPLAVLLFGVVGAGLMVKRKE